MCTMCVYWDALINVSVVDNFVLDIHGILLGKTHHNSCRVTVKVIICSLNYHDFHRLFCFFLLQLIQSISGNRPFKSSVTEFGERHVFGLVCVTRGDNFVMRDIAFIATVARLRRAQLQI